MSAITTRNGDNFDYSTAALLLDVNGELIQRTGITADSTDFISVTATDLMTGFLNSTDGQYDGSAFTVTVQNTSSSFTITQTVGFGTDNLVPGTGYTAGSGIATSGGGGTGMTVTITETAGVIDTVLIDNQGTGVYADNDTITILTGGANATFDLVATGISMTPTTSYVIAPLGSATFTFIKDSATEFVLMVKDSGTLYAPVGPVSANAIMVFDGTTGNLVSETGVLIDASNNISGITDMTLDSVILAGATSGFITLDAPATVTDYSITFPAIAPIAAGQVLTADTSGNTTWETPDGGVGATMYAFGPATAGEVAVTDTYQTIAVVDAPLITPVGFTNTGGSVAVTAIGTYLISFTVQFETLTNAGGARASLGGRLLLNSVEVSGSVTECYLREQNGDLVRPSVTKTVIVEVLTPGDAIELQMARTSGTSTAQTRANECSLVIRSLN